jgi:serine/threonine protein phosphatase PrpC
MTQTPAPQNILPVIKPGTAGVVCPRCQRSSNDQTFCEHCQFELLPVTAEMAVPEFASTTSWGLESFGVNWPEDPHPSFEVLLGKSNFRVRAIRPGLWSSLAPEVRRRQAITLNVLPPISIIEMGSGALVLAETWPVDSDRHPWFQNSNWDELLTETLNWCRKAEIALTELHAAGYVWLEFDPDAVETQNDQFRITNLDWRLFPIGQCPSHLARISPIYSAPEFCHFRDELIGPQTDVFHLAIAIYYRLAGFRKDGFPGRGLEAFRFEIPSLRIFRPNLPAGIWPVLSRALSLSPNKRQASVQEFTQQLEQAIEASQQSSPIPHAKIDETPASQVHRLFRRFLGESVAASRPESDWVPDIGSVTTAGRSKTALGSVNQDCAIVFHETVNHRDVAVMIVADGVSHARVGSGERASRLACQVLVDSIQNQIRSTAEGTDPAWAAILDQACQTASDAVVRDAFSIPERPSFVCDSDMMSTTILIAILDSHDLYVANVGDSRAYLVRNAIAEQMTVDGDVASSELMSGIPPEQVQELGSAGKALRFCVGACRENYEGEIIADLPRARPSVGHWSIETGTTWVFCSDGLVEERVFLEPDDLVRIINSNPQRDAQGLAECLVTAADARQRIPSPGEPNGYGDNISCIVLRLIEK